MLAPILVMVTVAFVAPGQGMGLDKTHVKYINLTSSPLMETPVVVSCEAELQHGAEATEIRLLFKTQNTYTWFAQVNFQRGIQTNKYEGAFRDTNIFKNIKLTGHLGKVDGTSKIKATWPKMVREVSFGEFVCDIVFQKNYVFKYDRSDKLQIGTIDYLMQKLKTEEKQEAASDDVLKMSIEKDVNLLNALSEKVKALTLASQKTAELLQRMDQLSEKLNSISESAKRAVNNSRAIYEMKETVSRLSDLSKKTENVERNVSLIMAKINTLEKFPPKVDPIKEEFASINKTLDTLSQDWTKRRYLFTNAKLINIKVNALEKEASAKFNIRHYVWPRGSYSLMMPRTGCPNNSLSSWSVGSRKLYTETTSLDNRNRNITADHFPLDVFTVKADGKKMATLRHCTHVDRTIGTFDWPRGSYCINRNNNKCPAGFKSGSLKLDEEDTMNGEIVGRSEGDLPDGKFDHDTVYEYCCRGDGDADYHIDLPIGQPFYLYRYGGHCQEVYKMNVTKEAVVIDTSDKDMTTKGRNIDVKTGAAPDGAVNNVHMELCYYAQI